MRQTREPGLYFHLRALDFSWSASAKSNYRHTSRILRIVLLWFIGGILLVESRPAIVLRTGGGTGTKLDISNVGGGLWAREGPDLTIEIPSPVLDQGQDHEPTRTSTPTSSLSPSSIPVRTPQSLVDPVNIALATIGGIAGVIFIGAILYKCYSKWSALNNDPVWPPLDAPRDEVGQLVELIRMGMIDAHGAPPHVINWVLNGLEAPWPPPGGVESLQRRRRRRRPRGEHNGVIELPRRTRARAARPLSTASTTVDPLPPYVRDPELDSSHYPITVIPPDFPPLPPDVNFAATLEAPSTSIVQPSEGNTHVHLGNIPSSSASSVTEDIDLDDESEVGSRRTASLRDHDEAPLTGLSPRPPPIAVLPSPGRNSILFSETTAAGTGTSRE